ncbi:MAG: DNA starvation/stationary phase protection protein [Thaumarchaeota archaeon]|nr:DNA starvation/stationary phase protection protein [Nitrososphaerota archaeon]
MAQTKEIQRPDIGLSEEDRKGVVGILSKLLADEYLLFTKTRNYHWNVVGPHFNDLHKFFESQYGEIDDKIDEIAERIRSLGGNTMATLSEFVQHTRLKENPNEYADATTMVSKLLSDHELVIRTMRGDVNVCFDKYHDIGTQDFITGLIEDHEKMAWMLRSIISERSQ